VIKAAISVRVKNFIERNNKAQHLYCTSPLKTDNRQKAPLMVELKYYHRRCFYVRKQRYEKISTINQRKNHSRVPSRKESTTVEPRIWD
jgi:hypothetical protein